MRARAELVSVSGRVEEEKAPGQIIYLFPGQGVQKVGMGKTLYESSEIAREILNQLKPELLNTMFNGPCADQLINVLDDTSNAQPAIVAVSLAIYFEFRKINPLWQPFAYLPHSTGQISALGASGVINIKTALEMATVRGRLMQEIGQKEKNKGGMLALLGATLKQAETLCANASQEFGEEGLWVANDNTIGQAVLSGRESYIAYAAIHAGEAGIKKAVRLPVSIAAHCPLMQEAQDLFAQYLENIKFERPDSPIILNTRPVATSDPDEVKTDLINGLTTGVGFREALLKAYISGVTSFVEIGAGPLSRLVQKAIPDSRRFQIST